MVMAAALALSACAGGLPTGTSPATSAAPASSSVGQRDLTPDEKKAIVDAVAPWLETLHPQSTTGPSFRQSRWRTGSIVARLGAKSPYAAYDGRQAYIVEAQLSGGKVTSATMALITGGRDWPMVSKMCAKYGLDPNKAS